MGHLIDETLGKWLRHLFFILVRTHYTLFYNISCSNKHLLGDYPGALIIATHVSRHDGPMIASTFYSSRRVRPTVHYSEFYNWAQWFPMFVSGAIAMSSPKKWPDGKRAARKEKTLARIKRLLSEGMTILIFPAGKIRRQEDEIVAPYLTGVHEILTAAPDTPVLLLRLDGIGWFQEAKYDGFWSFVGRKKGRRHINVDLRVAPRLDTGIDLADFNAQIEALLNTPISENFES